MRGARSNKLKSKAMNLLSLHELLTPSATIHHRSLHCMWIQMQLSIYIQKVLISVWYILHSTGSFSPVILLFISLTHTVYASFIHPRHPISCKRSLTKLRRLPPDISKAAFATCWLASAKTDSSYLDWWCSTQVKSLSEVLSYLSCLGPGESEKWCQAIKILWYECNVLWGWVL